MLNLFLSLAGSLWFDGYLGQHVMLIDDFCGSREKWCKHSPQLLLNLLDPYGMQGQIKGGFTWLAHKVVFMTANFNTTEWCALSY